MTDDDYSEQSKISKDYTKYGYRKLPMTIPEELGATIPHQHTSLVNWENDQMNFIQAVAIANRLQGPFRGRRPTCFSIADILVDEDLKQVDRDYRIKHLTQLYLLKYTTYPFKSKTIK